jgi:hypothetical protein
MGQVAHAEVIGGKQIMIPEEQIPAAKPVIKGWDKAKFDGEVEVKEGGSLEDLNDVLDMEMSKPVTDDGTDELFGPKVKLETGRDPYVNLPPALHTAPAHRYFKGEPGSCIPGHGIICCRVGPNREMWLFPGQPDTISACIEELQRMMVALDSKSGLINCKLDDESELVTIAIRIYPRNKPMDWSFLNPRNWFKSNGKSKADNES